MINISNKTLCCGCGACKTICFKKCIDLIYDEEGFLYPSVNHEKCVDCKACEKICPILNTASEGTGVPHVYAGFNKSEEVRMKSSSGGIFALLAKKIIDTEGCVFGAAFAEDFSVHHIMVEQNNDISMLMGSKYLQSRTESSFKDAEIELKKGRHVMYVGTPCQIEGLKNYLRKGYDNLFTVDFVCHGTPSPKLWKKYLDYREKLVGASIQKILFRHKEHGWKKYSLQISFKDSTSYLEDRAKDKYMRMFLNNYSLRPSCYECKFKKLNHASDITLGDFWEVKHSHPELDDDKGLSLIFIHSDKGMEIFRNLSAYTKNVEITLNEALFCNGAVLGSVKIPKKRSLFMNNLDKLSIDELFNIIKIPWYRRMISFIRWNIQKMKKKK